MNGEQDWASVLRCAYHWAGVILYCLAMVYIGWRIRTRIREDEGEQLGYEFWMAKRQLPGWRLAMSLTAGWLMLGWVGFGMSQIYMYGATGLWILPIPWLILCFIVILMVPFVRRIASVSLPQAIQRRYGHSARTMLAVLSFFVFIAWTQAELFMGGLLMSPFLNVPPWVCMAIMVAPIILYVYMGGFRANVATDVAQFLIMAPFMIILAVVAVQGASAASGGDILGAIQRSTPPWTPAGKGPMDMGALGWLFPVVLLIGYLPGWLIEQDLVIRLQAARSTKEGRKAAWWGLALIGIFVIILPSIIAFCSMVVYPAVNGTPNPAVGDTAGKEALYICSAFIKGLPTWLSVFMLVGILACQMSTVDTFANVSALALAYDLIEPRLAKKRVSPHRRLMVAKGISVFVLLVSLASAMISDSLHDVYYISSGVLSACVAVPAIFVFWRRTTLSAVLVAASVGFVGTVGAFIVEYHYYSADPAAAHYYVNEWPAWLQGIYGYAYIALGVLLSLVSIVVVSLVTGPATARQLAALQPAPVEDYGRLWPKPFKLRPPAVTIVSNCSP
jgi:SSS family solute:Na+ symporter